MNKLHPLDSFGIQKVSMSGIRIERLEDRIRPGVPFPHKHDFSQILLIKSGKGSHKIDFIHHDVEAGQIFMMKPGQMHAWELQKNVTGLVIEFHSQSLHSIQTSQRLIHDFSSSPDVFRIKNKTEFSQLLSLAEVMLTEFEIKGEMHDLALQGQLTSFLISLIRLYQKQPKQEKTLSLIERFRDLLEQNFKEKHSVEFYAQKLKISPKALTMQFSRSIGKPPRDLIQERLLLEAKRYLAFSNLSIAEIGYELGFEDANYFTRFFRTQEKKAPGQFRKEMTHHH